jgi:hypothetical protein
MSEQNTDANEEVLDSSAETPVVETNDASQESSPAQDAPQTVADIVAAVKEKHKLSDSDSSTEDQKTETPAKDKETPSKAEDVPFHNHPRFKELVEQKNEATKLVEEYRPLVERAKAIDEYLQKHSIASEDFTQTLELLALVKSNPAEAVKRLEDIAGSLKISTGEALPPDLQSEVDDGLITLDAAKREAGQRIELAKYKSQSTRSEQETQQRHQQELKTSLDTWTNSKASADPAFKPKSDANAPDGKFELVFAKFMYYWQTQPARNAQEAVALAEKAYTDVNNSLKTMMPKQPIRRPVSSTKSQVGELKQTIDVTKPGWARKVRESILA